MTTPQATLRKTLTLVDGVSIVVGITIGAGIFSTPQVIAGYQSSFGSIALYWILGGMLAFTGGLIYAELGARMPNTGGEYVYLTRAFGPYVRCCNRSLPLSGAGRSPSYTARGKSATTPRWPCVTM